MATFVEGTLQEKRREREGNLFAEDESVLRRAGRYFGPIAESIENLRGTWRRDDSHTSALRRTGQDRRQRRGERREWEARERERERERERKRERERDRETERQRDRGEEGGACRAERRQGTDVGPTS